MSGRIVLLDVMDTLVHEPFHREMPAFFGMSLAELVAAKHPTAWIDFELGRMDEAEFLAGFFRDRRAFDQRAFLACVRDAYRWVPGMEALVAELAAAGHELHALSNYPVWFRAIEERLGLSRFLEWSFVSCDTGVRKPNPRAFTGAAERLGVPCEACTFVDDREENVRAAAATGMRAVRFTSAEELRRDLAGLGLL